MLDLTVCSAAGCLVPAHRPWQIVVDDRQFPSATSDPETEQA